MKKRILIFPLLLILLLSGCDLRNRRPSSDFIPATNAPRTTSSDNATEPVETEPEVKELTRHSVRTVVSETASYTDIYGREWTYEYRIPFVDFPTTEASTCNIEIDSLYRRAISAQLTLAETGQPLTVPKIDYECYYTGELITLNVWKELTSGEIERSVYCFRSTGTMATSSEILEAVWIDPDEFLLKLQELVEARYVKDNAGNEEQVGYPRYLEKSLELVENVDKVTLYADVEDHVFALVKMYDAFGSMTQVEFEVRP